ncbi:hypothetical protein D9M71_584680 [compost metagenome]
MIHQMRRRRSHALRQGLVVLDDVVFFENVQGRQGRRARQRVAGVAVGVQEGAQGRVVVVEGAVDLVCGHARRQRQIAAGQGLGQAQEVRADTGLFTGEHRPGAAETDGDFVVDQVHAVAVAGFAQQPEVHRMVHAHATGALDQRLDNHGCDAVMVLGQGLLHRSEHIARMVFPAHALGTLVAVRARHFDGVHQ